MTSLISMQARSHAQTRASQHHALRELPSTAPWSQPLHEPSSARILFIPLLTFFPAVSISSPATSCDTGRSSRIAQFASASKWPSSRITCCGYSSRHRDYFIILDRFLLLRTPFRDCPGPQCRAWSQEWNTKWTECSWPKTECVQKI